MKKDYEPRRRGGEVKRHDEEGKKDTEHWNSRRREDAPYPGGQIEKKKTSASKKKNRV